MQYTASTLIIIGTLIAFIGVVWLIALSWFGKLPGGVVIVKDNSRFYFPLVTCILVSLVLTGIIWLVTWLGR